MKFGINNPAWLQMAGNAGVDELYYFEPLEDSTTFTFTYNNVAEISLDGISFTPSVSTTINQGERMYVRTKEDVVIPYASGVKFGLLTADKRFKVGGKMQPVKYDYDGLKYVFSLDDCENLVDASDLIIDITGYESVLCHFLHCINLEYPPKLPAKVLSKGCYGSCFSGCSSLKEAPELPAITLADSCYAFMFEDSGITKAPKLPVTTLANYCYAGMFSFCNLTEAPELPATILKEGCYQEMFHDASIGTIPELPATILADYCYSGMFQSGYITEAPELPATILKEGCYQGMFKSSKITKAPELPATILAEGCYQEMFAYCHSLTEVKCLATDNINTNNTENWFLLGSASGTFIKAAGVEWPTGNSGIPDGWTVVESAGDDFEVGEL